LAKIPHNVFAFQNCLDDSECSFFCVAQGGVDVTIKDVDSYPASFWGKAKKSVGGADISLRGDVDTSDPFTVDLDIRVSAFETAMQLTGKAGTLKLSLGNKKCRMSRRESKNRSGHPVETFSEFAPFASNGAV
jgi:hypothetical protein